MAMLQDESVSGALIRRSDLPDVGIVAVNASISGENESIIVRCANQSLIAWLNICPHQGRRLDYAPGKFLIDNEQLVCAAHGATFRLDNGVCVAGPCRGASLRQVEVRVDEAGNLEFGALV
jgi:nitrite reductase/ring-hydroxylating ferredoxin subunit